MTFIVMPNRKALVTSPKIVTDVPLIGAKEADFRGRKIVAVPHTPANNLILTKFGLQPPEPIRYYYNWPGRFTPFKHQIETAAKMSTHPRFFCFSGMGSAKTMAALWASDYLLQEGVIDRVVVCSPLSTLESVWGDSLFEHFFHRTFSVAHGPQREAAIAQHSNYTIINHHGVKTCYDSLKAMKGNVLWIVDEVAVFRNAKTDLFKHLWDLCGPKSNRMLWTLTGAPTPNAPTDIWAQARLVNPDLVPRYFGRFREQVMQQINQFKWVPKRGWEKDVYKVLQPSVRYATDDCIDLPPITYSTRNVMMSKPQVKAYEQLMATSVAEAKEGKISAINEAAKILKLCQIATGLVYTESDTAANLEPTDRLKECLSVIEQSGNKCIVFVPFKHILGWLVEQFGSKFKVAHVSGDVSATKRRDIFHDFQQGDLEVLVAHPKCMAHGINLTAGHTIVWWAPVNDFEIYDQANARVRRPGQNQHQHIVHLSGTYMQKGKLCPTVEDRLYKRLKNKEKMQGVLLDLLKS